MYYLGIDGGGTKTAFSVIDGDGRILSQLKTPTSNYYQIGFDGFSKVIRYGAAAVCEKAGITLEELRFSCIGIPNYGEISEDKPELEKRARAILGKQTLCVNDVVVAWAGSLGCKPGINLLAGTGSMGYGVDQKGGSARSGGWGEFCGDEGSAYWLGKKFIELFTKEADGRIKRGAIYTIARKEFGIKEDFDFLSIVLKNFSAKRDEIAKLQLLLNQAADAGDQCAIEAYRQAALELSLIVTAILTNLEFDQDKTVAVSYSGGIFKAGKLIFDPLQRALENLKIEFRQPLLSPVSGAALLALKSAGQDTEKALDYLCRQEKSL